MINVLCSACNTHLANTDAQRLDWPLTGEMFSIVYPGWFLRAGPVILDTFCPVCSAFPFHYNPYLQGGPVDKKLTVKGTNGKPVVMTVKQILMGILGPCIAPSPPEQFAPSPFDPKAKNPAEFPCPTCGAKKRFHKKGCAMKASSGEYKKTIELVKDLISPDRESIILPINYGPDGLPLPKKGCTISGVGVGLEMVQSVAAAPSEDETDERASQILPPTLDKHARMSAKKDQHRAADPFIQGLSQQISGVKGDTGVGPPTESEVKELLADREVRRVEREADELREFQGD